MLRGCFGMIWAIWGQCGGDLRYGRGALGHNRGTLGGKTDVSLVVSFYTDPNSAGTSSPSRSGAPGLLRSPTTDLSWTALASRNCRAPVSEVANLRRSLGKSARGNGRPGTGRAALLQEFSRLVRLCICRPPCRCNKLSLLFGTTSPDMAR